MVGVNSFKKKLNEFYDSGGNNFLNEYEIKGFLISEVLQTNLCEKLIYNC